MWLTGYRYKYHFLDEHSLDGKSFYVICPEETSVYVLNDEKCQNATDTWEAAKAGSKPLKTGAIICLVLVSTDILFRVLLRWFGKQYLNLGGLQIKNIVICLCINIILATTVCIICPIYISKSANEFPSTQSLKDICLLTLKQYPSVCRPE